MTISRRTAPRGLVRTVLALVILALLAGCGGGSGGSRETTTALRFGLSSEPVTLTAGVNQGGATNFVVTLVHRGLMTLDESGVVPGLAESVETPDDTTYVFTLRDGLTFHDGSPITADNVKSSLEYYADPANGSTLLSGLKDVDTITAEDDRTVTVTLSAPNNAFLEYLAIPVAAIVPDASLDAEVANQVGAGPYSWGELNPGVNLTLEKFDDYYGADDVSLESVEVAFYPDGDARTNALLSGDVDMIDYVTWENFERVEGTEDITLDAVPGPFQYVQFNVSDGPFADPLVRQAVAHAINRDNALAAAFQSHGQPLSGVVMPADDEALAGVGEELWSYDPEKAQSLLAEAGYPDGFSATMLSTSQYTFLQDTALSVQQDLKAVGIDVELDAPDWSSRLEKGAAGDYDIAVSGDAGIVTDPSYLLSLVNPPNSFNRSFDYENPGLADKITAGVRASSDEERVAAYEDAMELFAQDVPIATIDTRDQAWAYTSDLEGFTNLPGFRTFYSGYTLATASLK